MEKIEHLKITCPKEPDMEGTYDREEFEDEIREMTSAEPSGNDWIEWVMMHCDVDAYFSTSIINVVCMPEFIKGTFNIEGVEFTIEKIK